MSRQIIVEFIINNKINSSYVVQLPSENVFPIFIYY